MIVLVAEYTTKPGMAEAVLEALAEMVAAIKADEPGCPLFHVCRSLERPDDFLLYEHYVDEAALQAHRETPHFKHIIEGRVVPMLARRERELYRLVVS
jgi:quinol monooxygenase YgiN